MNKLVLMLLLVAGTFSTSAFANSVACVDADKSPTVQVSGTVKIVKHEHPNGSILTATMLLLDQPVCYTQMGFEPAVLQARQDSEIQVIGNNSGLVDGSRVKLVGTLTGNNVTAYYLSDTAIKIK